MSLGMAAATPITFLTYNVHLFGQTGMVGERETGLVFHDEHRAEQIAGQLRCLSSDVVGLTEVWDDRIRLDLESELADIYPYRLNSPSAQGIADVINSLRTRWPRGSRPLCENAEDIVDFFSQSHYSVGSGGLLRSILKYVYKEDWMTWALKGALRLPNVWGAGLLILSKYPLSNFDFFLHPVRADLERFAGKGTLKADVHVPGHDPISTFLTHAQEGTSREAVAARTAQIAHISSLAARAMHPVVVMGDLNDTREHWLARQFGLQDSFRTAHPNGQIRPGYTYDHNNPYAAKLGVLAAPHEQRLRIDYVLSDIALKVLKSRVLRQEFQDERGGYDLSDHFPIETEFVAA